MRSALTRVVGLAAVAAVATGSVIVPDPSAGAAVVSAARHRVIATRTFLDANGHAQTVATNKITMTVSQTANLRGRQEITVKWSGARPTGGAVADVNSSDGASEEYPFVLLECRGTDSTAVPKSQRLSPQTCWTQTWSERFQSDNTTGYPAWRSDMQAPAAERAAAVNTPNPRPKPCFRAALAERWVPFVAADGTTYPGGSVGCAGMAPESSNVGGTGIPSNATYAITGADGTGSAEFDVWTADENASLGCTDTVACSLVAIPIEGVSCDAFGTRLPAQNRPSDTAAARADATCRAPDGYRPGQLASSGIKPNPAVTGALWWSASNWRNRIAVPLTFATPASICSVVSTAKPLAIYGSILMNEATAQWQPKFCTDRRLFPFVHVQTADSAARTLLAANTIDVAFSSRAPDGGFGRPVVQAPVALSGFAITYAIDDAKGNRFTSLRLDARLVAKLLTQSYPADPLVRDNNPALAGNPMNLTQDPEFTAINPGLPRYSSTEAAATLLNLSTEADLVWALTSWINADPEARAWLNGTPDPWGMTVNPNYKSIELPVESWPLLDGFTLPQSYIDSENNPCYSYSPSPYLALIANPTAFVSTIVQDIQFAISNVNIGCPNGDPSDVSTLRLTVQGRQQPGFRFVLGVTPISAARRYSLQTAALQTRSTVVSGTRFTDATGRSFATPDDAGLQGAAALLHADKKAKTWTMPYDQFDTAAGQRAYPGAMPIFLDVPTSGLDHGTATRAAELLRFAATAGQRPGLANGQLPPGYLPLTSSNGLDDLSSYTIRAASAVTAQRGAVPGLDPPPAPTHSSPRPSPSAALSSPAPSVAASLAPVSAVSASPSESSSTSVATTATPPAATSSAPAAIAGKTAGEYSRLGSLALPLLILLGLLSGLLGSLLRYRRAIPAGVAAASRLVRRAGRGGAHR